MNECCWGEKRCECGRLLFKSLDLCGKVEIKCRRCGRIKLIECDLDGFAIKDADNFSYEAAIN